MTTETSAADNDAIVREFLRAWERRDADLIVEHLTEDAVYHAMPLTPIAGKPAIRAFLARRADVPSPRIVVHHQVASGDVVMNERTDHVVLNGRPVRLPICGVFEFEQGRIKAWREYLDLSPARAAYDRT
jgi:limonene-1,2-epoxide hydrolase